MNRLLALCAIVLLALGFFGVSSVPVVAQANLPNHGCGPASTWNTQTCIGPKGVAYCPQGMVLQAGTCQTAAPISPALITAGVQNQTQNALQNQVNSLSQQVASQASQIAALKQQLDTLQTKFENHHHTVAGLVTQSGKTDGDTHITVWNALGVNSTTQYNSNPTVNTGGPINN